MAVDEAPFDLSLDALSERTSVKWRKAAPGTLPLWIAEMDVALAPAVVGAVRNAVERGDTGYPCGPEYAGAYSDFATKRWGFTGYEPRRSSLVAGVMRGVAEVLKLVTSPGDPVVVTPPVYPPFYSVVEEVGRRVVEVPLGPGGRLDIPALGAALAPGGAFLLCNPHNPTGTVHTYEELAAVAATARASGVRVVSDEIHAPLVLPGAQHTPYLSVPGSEGDFAVVSASKGWNLAGLPAALVFCGPDAAGDLARLPEEVPYGPSHVGVLAHTAALREGQEWLDGVCLGLARNRSLLAELLSAHLPQVGWAPGAATYLAWLDFGCLGVASPAEWLCERARVTLSAGADFGPGGERFARLNFATSATVLERALRQMGEAVA